MYSRRIKKKTKEQSVDDEKLLFFMLFEKGKFNGNVTQKEGGIVCDIK